MCCHLHVVSPGLILSPTCMMSALRKLCGACDRLGPGVHLTSAALCGRLRESQRPLAGAILAHRKATAGREGSASAGAAAMPPAAAGSRASPVVPTSAMAKVPAALPGQRQGGYSASFPAPPVTVGRSDELGGSMVHNSGGKASLARGGGGWRLGQGGGSLAVPHVCEGGNLLG